MTQPTPQPTVPGSAEDQAALFGGLIPQQAQGQVWLGETTGTNTLPGVPSPTKGSKLTQPGLTTGVQVPVMMTKEQALAAYYSLDGFNKQSLIATAMKFGAKPEQINDASLFALWERYVTSAMGYQAQGKMLTPWQVMFMDIETQEKAKQDQKLEPPKGPVTTTQTSTDLSTRLDARGILYTASQTLLGRDPTTEEATRFWEVLNKSERENPTSTTTTTTYTPEGDIATQEAVSSGGMSSESKQMLAVDEAKVNPEYGAYQAATTYMDALRDLIYGKGY